MLLCEFNRSKRQQEYRYRHCARVVKGLDSKSNGVTRAGSNPADVVLFLLELLITTFSFLLFDLAEETL